MERKKKDEHTYEDKPRRIRNRNNDVPEGCRACGGPYPNCTDSCPLFDD